MAIYLFGREGATKEEKPRMVEARTAASAIAHVARHSFAAQVLTTRDCIAYTKAGVELETAGEEAAATEVETE